MDKQWRCKQPGGMQLLSPCCQLGVGAGFKAHGTRGGPAVRQARPRAGQGAACLFWLKVCLFAMELATQTLAAHRCAARRRRPVPPGDAAGCPACAWWSRACGRRCRREGGQVEEEGASASEGGRRTGALACRHPRKFRPDRPRAPAGRCFQGSSSGSCSRESSPCLAQQPPTTSAL